MYYRFFVKVYKFSEPHFNWKDATVIGNLSILSDYIFSTLLIKQIHTNKNQIRKHSLPPLSWDLGLIIQAFNTLNYFNMQ